ncbi:MAG: chorismate mutase, partial [Chloroflexi bacterium]|nr:chorismate mutase [Chloroflexota bacterium]
MTMACRGVRGAITCPANTREAILAATRELLEAVIAA